jgi:hypothetical protein
MSEKQPNIPPELQKAQKEVPVLLSAIDAYRADPTQENAELVLKIEQEGIKKYSRYDEDPYFLNPYEEAFEELADEHSTYDPESGEITNPYIDTLSSLKAEADVGTFLREFGE